MSVKIFFCYAREDELLLNKLKTQLKPLQRQGLIETWHDRDISAGTAWESEINQHLDAAHIILLLISPDFMDSDYCYGTELQRAIQRHERGEASVIPIILRPVHWYIDPLNTLQALPTDAKPVKTWPDLDDAFYNVMGGIRKVVKKHWLEKCNAHYKTGFYGEALQAITQVIRPDGRDVQLHNIKGSILHKLGRLEDALAAFEQAILLDPHDAVACCSKGLLLSEPGRYEDALRVCEHAIELDTSYAYAYYTKGKTLQELTRYQDALAVYEQAIRIDPNSTEAYERKGQVLHLLKQDTEAVLAYEQAAKFNLNSSRLFNAMGITLRDLNDDERALAAFEQAILLDPNNVSLLKEKAATLQRLKRLDEARDTYKKVRKLSDGSSLIEMNIECIDAQKGILVLKDAKLNLFLHIRITNAEVETFHIDNPSQEIIQRPLPRIYNLVKNIIEGFGVSITMITISEMVEETFYATITLKLIDKQMQYDSYVIDALVLAAQMKAPIFVEEDILEMAKFAIDQRTEENGVTKLANQTDFSKLAPSLLAELTPPMRPNRDRFNKFTDQARKFIAFSQEEAQRFQHNSVGTEHFLLGLICENTGVAAIVLANMDIELNKARSSIEFIVGRGDHTIFDETGLTPRAKKAIELALDEASRLNYQYIIGTEHLLLGLIRQDESTAVRVLKSLGVNLEKVRIQTIQIVDVLKKVSSLASLDLQSALQALELAIREKESAIQQQEYELAADWRDREVKIHQLISGLEKLEKI